VIDRNPYLSMLTAADRDLHCWLVSGDELEVGDVFSLMGCVHRVDALPPYEGKVYADEPGTRDVVVEGRPYTIAAPSSMFRILPRPVAA
jgi:hypothetical protein